MVDIQLTLLLTLLSSCPYLDNSLIKTQDGEEFRIVCDLDYSVFGGPYCPDNLLQCDKHADSLAECMEYCSEAHPLCKAVSWFPDMYFGYGNCAFKDDPFGGAPVEPSAQGYPTVSHSAVVTDALYANLDDSCQDERSYTSGNFNYSVDCYQSRTGTTNITSLHRNSLDGCLQTCGDDYSDSCRGVIFDYSLETGA